MLKFLVEIGYKEFLFTDPTEAMNFAITASEKTTERNKDVSIKLTEYEDDDAQEN